MTRDCIEISRYEEDDEDEETFWLSSQSIVFGYGIIDVSSRVARKVKSDKLLVVEDHKEGGHILVTSTIQGVCHGARWDTPGQIGLVEALPLTVPSPDELKLLKRLGPRHKDAAWVAIVVEEPHEEHRVGNCGNYTRFNIAVGGLSKPEVELARLCDDLRSFEPSLMSKSVACALAHAADAELNGLGLPHGARGEALRLLPGAPKSFFGKPYDQVLMDADFHRLVENLDEFNDWFGTTHTPEDIESISKTLINEHNRRHNLRHAHKFVKEKKCEPTADAIIEQLNVWYWCRADADKEVVRSNMDAILAPEADPDWNVGADDDVEIICERSLDLKCPTKRALVDGAFCQAAAKVFGMELPEEPKPLLNPRIVTDEDWGRSWASYDDFLNHSPFGMDVLVPDDHDDELDALFIHRRAKSRPNTKAWALFDNNVNFGAMAADVDRVARELGFRLEHPASLVVVMEYSLYHN